MLLGVVIAKLEFKVLGIAHRTHADLLVFVALHIVADVGAWIARQSTALSAVVSAPEKSKLLVAHAAVRPLGVWHPRRGVRFKLGIAQCHVVAEAT